MSITIDPDWWKTLFDEVYLVTDARSVCNEEITRREIELFCNLIPMHPQDRILDLCGGHGRHAMALCKRGILNCTVFDYARPLLKIGAENAERQNYPIRFIQGDARDTKLTEEEYDHVLILGNSLGYIPDKNADLFILRESFRVLKSKGWFLLEVTDGNIVREKLSPIAWHEIGDDVVVCRERELKKDVICAREMVLSKQKGLIRDKSYSIHLYEPQQLAVLVTKAGFIDVQICSDSTTCYSEEDLGCMNHRLIISARKP